FREPTDARRRRSSRSCPAITAPLGTQPPWRPIGARVPGSSSVSLLLRHYPLDGLPGLRLFPDRLGFPLAPDLASAIPAQELLLERGDRLLQGLDDLVVPVAVRDRGQHARVDPPQVGEELALEPPDVPDRDLIQLALGPGPDHHHLLLDRHRRVVRLLEQ